MRRGSVADGPHEASCERTGQARDGHGGRTPCRYGEKQGGQVVGRQAVLQNPKNILPNGGTHSSFGG